METGREVAVAPVGGATLRVGNFGQDDKAGQVLIERAEAVVDPGADAGITAEAVAAVHLIHRGRVIDTVDLTTAKETEVVGDLGKVLPVGGHVGAALANFVKIERAAHVVAFAAFHGRLLFALAGKLRQMHAIEHGFGIERIDVRRAALHHEENAVLGLGGKVSGFGCEGVDLIRGGCALGHHRGERDATDAGAEAVEEIAPSRSVQGAASRAGKKWCAHWGAKRQGLFHTKRGSA